MERRAGKNAVVPWRPYAFLAEEEPGPDGEPVEVATVFLTNRECPWRCLMCDLWRNTLDETVPEGAIAGQLRYALERLQRAEFGPGADDGTPRPRGAVLHGWNGRPPARWLKLYNSGSFFDPRAIPPAEYPEIAALAEGFERVIVECHPALARRAPAFRDLLAGRLEVAMGLETAHPEVLERLNKRMTLDQFRRAAVFLSSVDIDLRVFILVRPPWLSEEEGLDWAKRSLEFAFELGASVCSLIPTRAGNGAMEALARSGEFAPPCLSSLEAALEYGLRLGAGRVFADLWDIEQFSRCGACSASRISRLRRMNAEQGVLPPLECEHCEVGS